MGKYKRGLGVMLTAIAGICAIVAAILYRGVMYRFQPVYTMLIAAAVAACVCYVLAGFLPRVASYCPICVAGLMASAGVWGTQLMVNQLGYVVAGLDGVSTIMTWVYFIGFSVAGMILAILAAFMRASLKTKK